MQAPTQSAPKQYVLLPLVGLHSTATISSTSDSRPRDPEFESQLGYITFMEIDHEWNNFYDHFPASSDTIKAAVSYWNNYVHLFVNPLED